MKNDRIMYVTDDKGNQIEMYIFLLQSNILIMFITVLLITSFQKLKGLSVCQEILGLSSDKINLTLVL